MITYKVIPADQIFNACDPSFIYDIAVQYEHWWGAQQDALRSILHDYFLKEFDALTGHYTRLRESIKAQGLLNPIVVTQGESIWRKPWMIPAKRAPYICESCGGSRLIIAQELGLDVPCIVNGGDDGEVLADEAAVLSKFHDKTYTINYGPPCRVSPTRFEHMPDSYRMGEQQKCRRKIHKQMVQIAKSWKESNTKRCGM